MFSLIIPPSANTVEVQALNTTLALSVRSSNFFQPNILGHEYYNCPTMAFLITSTSRNPETGEVERRRVLFDAGARKDYWNYSPMIVERFRKGVNVRGMVVEKGIDEVLEERGVDLASVGDVVWSHWHFDHIGDMSKFPPSTKIIVGPGFSSAMLPGGHDLIELGFLEELKIGNFQAHDFFPSSPGALYLLSVPGHAIGHICALARTTPNTFLLLGADVCHFAGSLRPSLSIPLPKFLDPVALGLDDQFQSLGSCPCALFTECHPSRGNEQEKRTNPYYQVSTAPGSAYIDPDEANESVLKMQNFDADENVFICLAHDPTLFNVLPLFNNEGVDGKGLNEWKERGWKEKSRWGFLNELPRNGKAGRDPVVEGFWRAGKRVDVEEALRKDA